MLCVGFAVAASSAAHANDMEIARIRPSDVVTIASASGTTGTGACMADAQCDDGDPCTTDVCSGAAGCTHVPLAGVESARCVCDRTPPPSCAGLRIPNIIAAATQRACRLLFYAVSGNKSDAKVRRLLRRTAGRWRVAIRAVGKKSRLETLGAECGAKLQASWVDARARAHAAVP